MADSATPDAGVRQSIGLSRLARAFKQSAFTGPTVLFLICCGFCWKLVLSNQYTWIDNPDVVNQEVPRLQFQQTTWRSHEFPLWDPHLWCGQPFLGQIVGAAFPLNWPFFLVNRAGKNQLSIRQLNWYFVILHFAGALFAYGLCRELGLSRAASVFGGFVYSFSGFFAFTLWPGVLNGLLMAPLVLLFLVRVLRRYRPFPSAALCGMFLGLSWLSGHHEIPIYLSVTVGAVWLYDLACHRQDWWRSLRLASTTALFTVLTSGLQTIPGYEYAKLAVRWVGADHPVEWHETIPYAVHSANSLPPSSLIAVLVPWGAPESDTFVGVVVLSLVSLAVLAAWQNRWVRLFTSVALGALLLALGGWNLFHGLLYALLPLFEKARAPNRIIFLFGLALAILAAFGFDGLRAGIHLPLVRKIRLALLTLAGFIFSLALAALALQKPGPSEALVMLGLIAALLAAVLAAGQSGWFSPRSLTLAVTALAIIELGNGSTRIYWDLTPDHRDTLLPNLTQFRDIADFLRSQPGPLRVNAAEVTGPFNLGDWEGIDTLSGYGAGLTKNIRSLDWPSVRTQNLLAVDYSLSKQPPRSDQQIVFRSSTGISVLRNLDALPRARIVHQIELVSSPSAVARRVNDASFDARNTVLMPGAAPKLQTCTGDEPTQISRRTANSVTIEARLACRGMLILADTWYPGWMATVDSHPTPIFQAYVALRGVVLEQGDHHVEFHYRPASGWTGALMSAIGVLGACAIALWKGRASKP